MKARYITIGGILSAIILVLLYSAAILPTNKLALLTIASSITPLALIMSSEKNAFFVYLCSSILALLIIPKSIALIYILFFGIYGLVKYYIEKLKKLPLEIFLKLLFFNLSLGLSYLILKSLFIYNLGFNLSLKIYYLIPLAEIVFLIFDYSLTIIISFYLKKFKIKDL